MNIAKYLFVHFPPGYFSEALEKAKNEIEGDIEENKEAIAELKKWQTEIKKDKETICEVLNKIDNQ